MEQTTTILLYIVLFNMLIISMYTDYKEHKILNSVTFSGMGLGIFLNTFTYGMQGFISCMISMGIAFVILIWFCLLKQLGYGDLKLILAMAAIMNVFYTFGALIVGSTLAAIYAISKVIKTKNRKLQIPYGIFVGIGTILYQIGIWITIGF